MEISRVKTLGLDTLNFGDWASFVAWAGKARPVGKEEFYGNISSAEALRMAVEGWQAGTERINHFTDLFLDKLTPFLQVDEYFYDVTGQDWDISRVLEGEPECWINAEQVEVKAPANQVIRLVVQAQALAVVSPEAMMWKGASVVALVALLEKSRRRVQIDLAFYNSGLSKGMHLMNIPLKAAGDNSDYAKLAFALAHPACFRHLGFGVMEKEGFGGKGSSQNLTKGEEMDILVPKGEPWDDKASCEAWILKELAGQGIELNLGDK